MNTPVTRPKTIVPLMGATPDDLQTRAAAMKDLRCDWIEWRVDALERPFWNEKTVVALAAQIRAAVGKPLIVTCRTVAEGGNGDVTPETYVAWCRAVITANAADFLDVELSQGAATAKELIALAHRHGVRVILSSHDFHKTPDEATLVNTLRTMSELGADLPKIAVMPQTPRDVLTLLSASLTFKEHFAKTDFIAIAMGELGAVSRLAGNRFGSAATFCVAGQPSAPGQMGLDVVNEIILSSECGMRNAEFGMRNSEF
jgi:3-dehydroquinate dehydratase-1